MPTLSTLCITGKLIITHVSLTNLHKSALPLSLDSAGFHHTRLSRAHSGRGCPAHSSVSHPGPDTTEPPSPQSLHEKVSKKRISFSELFSPQLHKMGTQPTRGRTRLIRSLSSTSIFLQSKWKYELAVFELTVHFKYEMIGKHFTENKVEL